MFFTFVLLSLTTGALFALSLFSAVFEGPILIFFPILVVFVALLTKVVTLVLPEYKRHCKDRVRPDALVLLTVVAGAVLSYILNVHLELGAIVASALVGIVGAVMVPGYAVPIYCGSFVGMVSPLVLHDFLHVLIAGIIAGTIFMFSKGIYNGYGGKLGACAFISWIIVNLFSSVELLTPQSPDLALMLEITIYSAVAAYLTYLFSTRLKHDVVTSSSLVSLLAGLVLPAIHPETGGMLSAVAMSASFAGMSSKKVVKTDYDMLIISVMVGLMFVYSYTHFGGAGGKLGTIAFGSVIAYRGFFAFYRRFLLKRRRT